MASKRKTRKRRRGIKLRMPSSEPTTPIKMVWGSKPAPKDEPVKGEAEPAA